MYNKKLYQDCINELVSILTKYENNPEFGNYLTFVLHPRGCNILDVNGMVIFDNVSEHSTPINETLTVALIPNNQ